MRESREHSTFSILNIINEEKWGLVYLNDIFKTQQLITKPGWILRYFGSWRTWGNLNCLALYITCKGIAIPDCFRILIPGENASQGLL